ncbi:MAG: zinc ribbon domain-containing protein [Chloroflexi bacterium]|nr:zinc ribbon domain-containing protein [Chloroflexota bacterium]
MPIYEYNCKSCGKDFEKIVPCDTKDADISCSECGRKDARRKVSLFASKITGKHGVTESFSSSMAGGSGCSSCTSGNCSTCGL